MLRGSHCFAIEERRAKAEAYRHPDCELARACDANCPELVEELLLAGASANGCLQAGFELWHRAGGLGKLWIEDVYHLESFPQYLDGMKYRLTQKNGMKFSTLSHFQWSSLPLEERLDEIAQSVAIPRLFQAVRSAYDHARQASRVAMPTNFLDSLRILDLLLAHGADLQARATFLALNTQLTVTASRAELAAEPEDDADYPEPGVILVGDQHGRGATAFDFALALKQSVVSLISEVSAESQSSDHFASVDRRMAMVVSKLSDAGRKAGNLRPTMSQVPKSTHDMWCGMLLNKRLSDCTFRCQADGGEEVTLPAHKVVLAAASPYFDALVSGRWGTDGCITTTTDPAVLRAVLTFVYTGVLLEPPQADVETEAKAEEAEAAAEKASGLAAEGDSVGSAAWASLKDERLAREAAQAWALQLLAVAAEYSLVSLQQLCEQRCIQTVSAGSVQALMEKAHLLGCFRLKQACFAFVRQNSIVDMLTAPEILTMAAESPALYVEMVEAIGGGKNTAKRFVHAGGGEENAKTVRFGGGEELGRLDKRPRRDLPSAQWGENTEQPL